MNIQENRELIQMPLNKTIAQEAKVQYSREFDRYEKLAQLVHSECERIVRDCGVLATVQWRAKTPKSFYGKLIRFLEEGNEEKIQSVDLPLHAIELVGDLAGIRVATYVEADRRRVVAALNREFVGPNRNDEVEIDEKEKSSGYRATHCQVCLPESYIGNGAAQNILDVSAEIQVCSMLAHVWNEIEHDIRYKVQAPWDEDEPLRDSALDEFLRATERGDEYIADLLRLQSYCIARKLQEDLEVNFSELNRFRDNGIDTLAVFVRLGYADKESVETNFLTENWLEKGRRLVTEFNGFLSLQHHSEQLGHHDGDVLLCLILEQHYEDILAVYSKELEQSPIPRIFDLSGLWSDWKKF